MFAHSWCDNLRGVTTNLHGVATFMVWQPLWCDNHHVFFLMVSQYPQMKTNNLRSTAEAAAAFLALGR
jgi:hypothetical protein